MIQNKIVEPGKLDPAYLDRGTFFGDGVYEVVRSYNGRLFALEDHLERFEHSRQEVGINGPALSEIRRRVEEAFRTSQTENCIIYFHLTRGSQPRNPVYTEDLVPNFFLSVTEAHSDPSWKSAGITASTYPDLRWKRCDIKSLNLLPNIMAKNEARKNGHFEALLVDDEGYITEGASSAFFGIEKGAVVTRPHGHDILPSITRKYVLKLAEATGMGVVERPLTPAEAVLADELFLAVTTQDILPVVAVNDNAVGDGRPGPYAKKLMKAFRDMVAVQQ